MNEKIDISGLDKADVLQAAFNHSKQQGLGLIDPMGTTDLTKADAEAIVSETLSFDYLHGRILKIELAGDEVDPWLYDRDNGEGAFATAIDTIRPGVSVG